MQQCDATWPESGAVPVFRGDPDDPELVGFTTTTLPAGFCRLALSRPIEGDPDGAVLLKGEAVVIERDGPAGPYLAWLVVDGDPEDLPRFWPA